MEFEVIDREDVEISKLFAAVFSASEGEEEGQRIGELVSALLSSLDNQDIWCVVAVDEGRVVGGIFFTRLLFQSDIDVFMLAPVAVAEQFQAKGVGQALINFGLGELKRRSVGLVVTYGDPAFYAKVGFFPLSEDELRAPLRLSMPEGWLVQSLTDEAVPRIDGRPRCVEAFNDPVLW